MSAMIARTIRMNWNFSLLVSNVIVVLFGKD